MKTNKDSEYSFNHTKQRFKERFDIDLTKKEYLDLCNKVKTIKPLLEEKQKNDIQKTYKVKFKGKDVLIVWSTTRNCITTVLKNAL